MELKDGLTRYRSDPSYWELTLETERAAKEVLDLLKEYCAEPIPAALTAAKDLLIQVEKWKAMCLKDRMGNAERNTARVVWDALRGAINANNDLEALRSIMLLKGFGSHVDEETGQRRAKLATSVLRFLQPEDWGVVDWRTIALLSYLKSADRDINLAVSRAQGCDPRELRNLFDIVDEAVACEVNQKYRSMRTAPPLSRAADIDMALFGISLAAWPL